jgi:hypothetical protein
LTIQTKTLDEIPYEHRTQVRKPAMSTSRICNFRSLGVYVPLWKHTLVKIN